MVDFSLVHSTSSQNAMDFEGELGVNRPKLSNAKQQKLTEPFTTKFQLFKDNCYSQHYDMNK